MLVCSINPQTANETLSVRTLVNMFTTGWIEQQVKFFFENRDLPYQWVEKNALNQCFTVITRYSQLSFRVEVIQRGWLKTQNIPNQKKKKNDDACILLIYLRSLKISMKYTSVYNWNAKMNLESLLMKFLVVFPSSCG